jgi:hypothetical protein
MLGEQASFFFLLKSGAAAGFSPIRKKEGGHGAGYAGPAPGKSNTNEG